MLPAVPGPSPHPDEARAGAARDARLVSSSVQVLVYEFGAGADFEGRLVGALERLESGGALRVRDLLFVMREPESGELSAIGRRGDGTGGFVGPLLDFRLDAAARARATAKTLRQGPLAADLGAGLAPGCAIAAVLVEHVWREALEDAVARSGGTLVASDFVAAGSLAEVAEVAGLPARPA